MIREHRLPADVLAKLPQLVERLKDTPSVQALYFFGSLARGELKPLSDLDLALLLDRDLTKDEIFARHLDVIGLVSDVLGTDEFDLLILNRAPLRMAYHVLKEGRLMFFKERRQLADFRERVIKLYLDFARCRKQFDRAFMQGVGLGG